MKLTLRGALLFAAAFALALGGGAGAQAQNFPSRPITLIVPFPPGGPTDTVGRIMAEHMKTTLGQTVVVDNVAGAGGTLGMARAVRAAPDGYTLIVGQWTTHVGDGALYPLTFDVLNDYAPISLLTTSHLWIVGKKGLPAKDLKELVAWLKANPGKASVGTVGVGSAAHICVIDFANKTKTSFQLVPYRGGAPAMQDLVGGQIDFMCPEASQTLTQVRAGNIKVYGIMSKKRWFAAPDVPTMEEAGVPGLSISFWHGLWAPKGTPKDIIAKLNDAVVKAFADETVKKRFAELGHEIPSLEEQNPQALYAHQKAEIEKWWPIIKAAHITVN